MEEEKRNDGPEEEDESESGDHHLDRHRSWLNRKQKKVLRGMRQRGHASHELHDKIHQFYEVSPDEVKATARGILQKGCEAILQRVFGQYKAEEIIQAKEEGASNAEMDEKIDEALAQIRNPGKREEAARFAMTCRRIFTMVRDGGKAILFEGILP